MTDRYAVIGNPVAHSKSPLIHAQFARQTGEDIEYGRLLAPLDRFAETVAGFRAGGGRGANVTLPFKVEAFRLATTCSARAVTAQAVNTLRFEGDAVYGDNTDGAGLVRDIRDNLGVAISGSRVLLLGAGGAARAVGLALAQAGVANIWICNRTHDRAESMAHLLAGAACETRVGTLAEVSSALAEADWVVNATSIGLLQDAPPLFDYGRLRPPLRVFDLVFFPRATPFLRRAREQGCETLNGVGMLLHQAVLSFERWTGHPAPTDLMRHTLTAALVKREQAG